MCIFVFSLFLLAVKSPKSLESGSPNSILLLSGLAEIFRMTWRLSNMLYPHNMLKINNFYDFD